MELLFIVALFIGVMWLMTSRGRKQQREVAAFRAELEPGQEVMTGSGLFGTVVAVDGDVITLEIAPGVTTRWLRPAIGKPAGATDETEDDELEDEPETEDEGIDSAPYEAGEDGSAR